MSTTPSIGEQLRDWRQRRRLSQLDLALDVDISTRHLSFVETGRSHPSREMILRLAQELDVPLRTRNAMLLAAGYAPVFADRSLDDRTSNRHAPPSRPCSARTSRSRHWRWTGTGIW